MCVRTYRQVCTCEHACRGQRLTLAVFLNRATELHLLFRIYFYLKVLFLEAPSLKRLQKPASLCTYPSPPPPSSFLAPPTLSAGVRFRPPLSALSLGSGDLNTRPQTSMRGTVLTEPSPQYPCSPPQILTIALQHPSLLLQSTSVLLSMVSAAGMPDSLTFGVIFSELLSGSRCET